MPLGLIIAKYLVNIKQGFFLPTLSLKIFGAHQRPPGQIPLKVPNIEFDFDVSVDREHWRTVTSKSNSRPYNNVQMSI